MPEISCHCGQVRITIEKWPDALNECNCSLCSKAGAWWAYLDPSEITVEGEAKGYCRRDKADPAAQLHFCAECGSTAHFILTPSAVAKFGNTLMGVNMRLANEPDLAGTELRYPDGAAWSGQGEFGFVRESRILGRAETSD